MLYSRSFQEVTLSEIPKIYFTKAMIRRVESDIQISLFIDDDINEDEVARLYMSTATAVSLHRVLSAPLTEILEEIQSEMADQNS